MLLDLNGQVRVNNNNVNLGYYCFDAINVTCKFEK